MRPEKITTATGWSTSVPGCSASNNNGANANAVTNAVIKTGLSRSNDPRIIIL